MSRASTFQQKLKQKLLKQKGKIQIRTLTGEKLTQFQKERQITPRPPTTQRQRITIKPKTTPQQVQARQRITIKPKQPIQQEQTRRKITIKPKRKLTIKPINVKTLTQKRAQLLTQQIETGEIRTNPKKAQQIKYIAIDTKEAQKIANEFKAKNINETQLLNRFKQNPQEIEEMKKLLRTKKQDSQTARYIANVITLAEK